MRRNNEDRLMQGHKPQQTEEVPMANPLDFITPTQFVDLPSKGRYPEGHPMHGKESIEIKYMTAKDEDILTNRSLLKKGLAIDRLIQNVVRDSGVNASDLYVGDRNSILIHARASAYGDDYKTKIKCPACQHSNPFVFKLSDHEVYHGDQYGEEIVDNGDGTFNVTLPMSKIVATIAPMTGHDEIEIMKDKKDPLENILTEQMRRFCLAFNGYKDSMTINQVIDNLPAGDSRVLREASKNISPDIKMEANFACGNCDHEEVITVPLGTDFFWPDR